MSSLNSPCGRKLRINLDRFVVIGNGVFDVAFGPIRKTAIAVGIRKSRVDLDRLAIIRNGAILVAYGVIQTTPVIIGSRELRIDTDRPVVVRYGVGVVPLARYAMPRLL